MNIIWSLEHYIKDKQMVCDFWKPLLYFMYSHFIQWTGCPYSYQHSIMLQAVTQAQKMVSWKPLSSMAQKDTVSSYIFHEVPTTNTHSSNVFSSNSSITQMSVTLSSNYIYMLLICFPDNVQRKHYFLWRKYFILFWAKTLSLKVSKRLWVWLNLHNLKLLTVSSKLSLNQVLSVPTNNNKKVSSSTCCYETVVFGLLRAKHLK